MKDNNIFINLEDVIMRLEDLRESCGNNCLSMNEIIKDMREYFGGNN